MTQQAKDIYSGIKKIFPGSRRSGSFSFGSRFSSTNVRDSDLAAAVRESDLEAVSENGPAASASVLAAESRLESSASSSTSNGKKERRPSFSFSGWKEKHHISSAKKKAEKEAKAAEKAVEKSNRDRSNSFGRLNQKPASMSFDSSSATAMYPKRVTRSVSHSQVSDRHTNVAAAPSSSSGVFSSSSSSSSRQKLRSNSSNFSGSSSLGAPSSSGGRGSTSSVSSSTSGSTSNVKPMSLLDSQRNRSTSLSHRRTNSSSSITSTTSQTEGGSLRKTDSFLLQQRKSQKSATAKSASTMVQDDMTMGVKKPHASTWDSDSDQDDYDGGRRPATRGLDRRSQSMDFVDDSSSHLMSKIWRKLPIQARLIAGRGNVDLDLQKDRASFSRSSSAKQHAKEAEKIAKEYLRQRASVSSPNPIQNGKRHVSFNHKMVYYPARGKYRPLIEGYDDILVRVCRFAAHDQRPTTTKVTEFLERSMAFLHGTRTKHGNVVSISNEEIRMWRRLALHDWTHEDLALKCQPEESPVPTLSSRRLSKKFSNVSDYDERQSTLSNDGGDDSPLSISVEQPQPDESDEDLKIPDQLSLVALLEIVNSCVNFGDCLFSFDEIDDLIRLDFLVEEDGWI